MATLRHPTMSFNFVKPGEPFEVPDEDASKLVERYGCEVVGEPAHASDVAIKIEGGGELIKKMKEVVDEPLFVEAEVPVETSPGWWLYDGKKMRKSKLPPEALALLE